MFCRLFASALSLGLASLVSGCFLDGTAFQGPGSGGSGAEANAGGGGEGGTTHGTTSAGGATSSTSGTTESTGSTGTTSTTGSTTTESSTTTSTTTSTMQCTYDTDCPDPDPFSFCLEPRCVNGACGATTANDGVVCGLPPSQCHAYPTCQSGQCDAAPLGYGEALPDFDLKDCKKPVCDGAGNAIDIADAAQTPDSTSCADKSCSGTTVVVSAKAEGDSCFVPGAFKCCSGHCCTVAACMGCVD